MFLHVCFAGRTIDHSSNALVTWLLFYGECFFCSWEFKIQDAPTVGYMSCKGSDRSSNMFETFCRMFWWMSGTSLWCSWVVLSCGRMMWTTSKLCIAWTRHDPVWGNLCEIMNHGESWCINAFLVKSAVFHSNVPITQQAQWILSPNRAYGYHWCNGKYI